ncbi:Tm-1-like ATP-binding domain-containing protein [Maribacter sp. 2307ULW6-5]|uniref:Tm-1-like ATP-binding domain-containing protein n=1 Tax=Maribacter sp. 2307ULW6-5 TaxID=3386275 RepID=UPI0039BD4120
MKKVPKTATPNNLNVVMVGCFDTKGEDFECLYACLVKYGVQVTTMNVGVLGTTDRFPVTIQAETVALAAGLKLSEVKAKNDRGAALEIMGNGAANILSEFYSRKIK